MRITLDTNALYQALRSRISASYYILELIRSRKLELALSVPVFLEYRDVLSRPKSLNDLKLSARDINAALRFIAYIGKPFPIHYLMRPNLRDEADNMFVDLAFASNSQYLITQNITDFTSGTGLQFDSFTVVTPATFAQFWRRSHEETP